MNDDRRSILTMLAEGKITADEAERLLAALDRTDAAPDRGASEPAPRSSPKYLRVAVDTEEGGQGPTKVNIRVPLSLMRAGVRLASLIPPQARDQVNAELSKNGVAFDISQIKPENLDDLIDQLNDLQLDVDQEKTKVRIYCE